LEWFSDESKKKNLILYCFDLLKRTASTLVGDLLMKFCDCDIVNETHIEELQTVLSKDSPATSKQQAIRLVTKFLLKYPEHKHLIKLLYNRLADSEPTVVRDATDGLKEIINQNLDLLFKQNPPTGGLVLTSSGGLIIGAQPPLNSSASSAPPGLESLFPRETWELITSSSLTLMTDLVTRRLHETSKNLDTLLTQITRDKFLPACRALQCKHLPSIIGLMEVPSPGMQLLADIMLGETSQGNNFSKTNEDMKLKAVAVVLSTLNDAWRSKKPQAEIINEFTKGNPFLQLIANIVVETLGPQAAQTVVLFEDLLKTKLDLLNHCSMWVWSALPSRSRSIVFMGLINHRDQFVRCHMVHLQCFEFLFSPGQLDNQIINHVLDTLLLSPTEAPLVLRQCIFFLDRLSKSQHPPYQTKAILTCGNLLQKYGFEHQDFSEPALRILREMIQQSTDPSKLIYLMIQQKIKYMIIQYFTSKTPFPIPKHRNYCSILMVELLQYFFDPTPTEVDIWLACLLESETQISRVAIKVLSTAPSLRITAISEQVFNSLLKEKNPFVVRNVLVLLGSYGRLDDSNIRNYIQTIITKLASSGESQKQEHAVTLLGVIKRNDNFANQVILTLLEKVISENTNPKSQVKAKTISLVLASVNAITDIGAVTSPMVTTLLSLLQFLNEEDIRIAVFLCFKVVKKPEMLDPFRGQLEIFLKSPNNLLRDIALKIIRVFGPQFSGSCLDIIKPLLEDPFASCRKNSLKILEQVSLYYKDQSKELFQATVLTFTPAISKLLDDKNYRVVAQTLHLIQSFKPTKTQYYVDTLRDTTNCFYSQKVIKPNSEKILKLLQKNPPKDICMGVLFTMGEYPELTNFVHHFKQVLNTEQVSTIADFAEAWQVLVPEVLQHCPFLFNLLQPTNSLIRHFVRLLQLHINLLTPEACNKLFTSSSIEEMLRHRSPSVRTIGIQLMGKKCLIDPQMCFKVLNYWKDKNGRIHREVMNVIGNFGKTGTENLSLLLNPNVMKVFDNNPTHIWSTLSHYWQIPISGNFFQSDEDM